MLRTGKGPVPWGLEDVTGVLRFALAAYERSAQSGIGVNPTMFEC